MKVLFVASGNKKFGVSSFVASQAKSLEEAGVNVSTFRIVGHGIIGYLSNLKDLRKTIKKVNPDIIHAHYSLCGILASIASRKPLIVSILGSFPNSKSFKLRWVRFFIKHIWDTTIVKSSRTASQIGVSSIQIIPNGVNLEQFIPFPYKESRKVLNFEDKYKYVIFVSNPSRIEKNYELAEKAVRLLNDPTVKLIAVYDKPHDEVVRYMSAADVLVLTSDEEGSPNVVKEAMACNCPIVSTDVGDVQERIGNIEGCIVADGDPRERNSQDLILSVSNSLRESLCFTGRTNGRMTLLGQELDSISIAKKIITIYENTLHERKN